MPHVPASPADVLALFAAATHERAVDLAAPMGCAELDAYAAVLTAAGHPDAAVTAVEAHDDHDECQGHAVPAPVQLFDERGEYTPAPGTEYPFSVSDIARAASRLLGPDWLAESGYWGITGTLSGPYIGKFTLLIDEEGDLYIEFSRYAGDDWPEDPKLPDGVEHCDGGVFLVGASAPDGLDFLAAQVAAAVRAVTGR
ncbi:hypothetical protein HHL19_35770 [Streptomyces sp. R302]|uniref:hypothetical protein n=1 Tax=unclassified Streptomyces TaxID=2593676 RepID=UPI00145EFD8A|nr:MULTISPECIES: hypothetical protein [unclassified Streptomyces]NML55101.1 hypothetical protein [Streptomyces sp. R301]NML83869.1 hypothetical protein [Streptomyces sp. R302]